jgi:5-methylcytosine-specific restriction endonuclease McrA
MYGYLSYAQMEIDHKIPLCLGGSNNIENLQPLSKNDHKIKTDHDLMLFNYVRQCMMTIKEAQSEVNNWK